MSATMKSSMVVRRTLWLILFIIIRSWVHEVDGCQCPHQQPLVLAPPPAPLFTGRRVLIEPPQSQIVAVQQPEVMIPVAPVAQEQEVTVCADEELPLPPPPPPPPPVVLLRCTACAEPPLPPPPPPPPPQPVIMARQYVTPVAKRRKICKTVRIPVSAQEQPLIQARSVQVQVPSTPPPPPPPPTPPSLTEPPKGANLKTVVITLDDGDVLQPLASRGSPNCACGLLNKTPL